MAGAGVGALVVEDIDGQPVGLISEREVTLAVARWGGDLATRPVRSLMADGMTTVSPDTPIVEAMRLMTVRRSRHLPVVDRGRLVGIISIGDVLKSRLEEKTAENQVLMDIARWPRAA
jgi:CBS domain-containing protein